MAEVENSGEGVATERPEYLLPQYKTVEDQAKAVVELQKMMGERSGQPEVDPVIPEVQPEVAPVVAEVSLGDLSITKSVVPDTSVFDKYAALHDASNSLTPEQYQEYTKESGVSLRDAELQFKGYASEKAESANAVLGAAGGQEKFQEMSQWASQHQPQGFIDAFNAALDSKNATQIDMAVKSLKADYQTANPSRPALVTGNASSVTSTQGYKTLNELVADQSNPKYKAGDPEYHDMVDRKLKASNL